MGNDQVVAREFVIDIDIDGYPKRSCCQQKPTVCSQCWGYLVVAMKVVSRALEEGWGYKRLLWVYSGRRGVHLWVCDKVAMMLSDEERQTLMKRLSGFRNLRGEEVSTWRPERATGDVKEKSLADRMRRPIESSFRYERYIRLWLEEALTFLTDGPCP